jgi:LysR family transcriptional regulator, glycine cleavage system transcriptional activator
MTNNRVFVRDKRMLRSLQYFESVARHGSVKLAAEENHVSASAVSHQLRELSNYLGEEILVRSGRAIRLTETGEQLFQHVSGLFESLDRVLEATVGQTKPLIRLAVCSSFGPSWLAKRIPDFQERNPSIDVELRMFSRDPLQTDLVADAVVTAAPASPGFVAVTLFEEMLVAVGGPNMPQDENGMPMRLLTTDTEHGMLGEDWHDFCAMTGRDYVGAATDDLMRCTHYLLAVALAQANVGAALVPDFVAADALEKGELILLYPEKLPARRVYNLCYKVSRARDPALRSLASWMKAQVKDGPVAVSSKFCGAKVSA